jgi:hypothetical protein
LAVKSRLVLLKTDLNITEPSPSAPYPDLVQTDVDGALRFWLQNSEIRRDQQPAGTHKLIDLLSNFPRLGFQPLIL